MKPLDQEQSGYASFWEETGTNFPSLKGAASTEYYRQCEQIVFEEFCPTLKDRLLLKTDLWDEAKNSETLQWAAKQGARAVGIDVAFEIARQAREALPTDQAKVVVADVRALPFPSHTFDVIYSMGTIEHFSDYDVAVRELFRVLRPGGTAIIGVPNTLDPYLRPLLVWLLQRLGLYAYGLEKSFTPRGLRRLLEAAGFRVTAETGLLFIPGWLRMLDLLCHVRQSRATRVTGWLVRPFSWLYRRVPTVRRHGYLIAAIVEKPPMPS